MKLMKKTNKFKNDELDEKTVKYVYEAKRYKLVV